MTVGLWKAPWKGISGSMQMERAASSESVHRGSEEGRSCECLGKRGRAVRI